MTCFANTSCSQCGTDFGPGDGGFSSCVDHGAVIVVGGPRAGKTTWALSHGEQVGCPVRHTDDLISSHDWSAASEEVSRWIDDPGPWVIEGVATARALRKWLAANPGKALNAKVVFFSAPVVDVTSGQAAMAKGVLTVWREIEVDVRARRARVEVRS